MNASAAAVRRSISELGMWVFLATEVLFFTRLHYPAAFAAASRHTDVVLGTLNTAILLTSSLTMALAVSKLRLGAIRGSLALLTATFLLGAAFFGLKILEYSHDYAAHLVPWLEFVFPAAHARGARLFFLLYFVMTGAHAVHLIVGLGLLVAMIMAIERRRLTLRKYHKLEMVGLYWHLIDIVWIFLYPLLYLVARA